MKAFEETSESINDATIDRLVDGDLPDSERKDLLLRLEADPEGWRRCALAFLEDQGWRNALMAANLAHSTRSPMPHASLPGPARGRKTWLRRSMIAATLVASTFVAGFAAGSLKGGSSRVEIAKPTPPEPAKIPSPPQPGEIREVGTFQLVDGSAGEAPAQSFPILSGPGLDDRWLRSQPPSVPDYLRASWERQGFQVAERRKLVSVELKDGGRVSIPVDEVEVDYVGQRPL